MIIISAKLKMQNRYFDFLKSAGICVNLRPNLQDYQGGFIRRSIIVDTAKECDNKDKGSPL